MKDLASRISVKNAIDPAAARTTASNATTTGAAIDTAGYESVTIAVTTGTVTDGTGQFSLTECDTVGGTYTPVVVGDLIAGSMALTDDATLKGVGLTLTTAASHDNAAFRFGYRGTKRFIKVIATLAGSAGQVFSACVILGYARNNPPA